MKPSENVKSSSGSGGELGKLDLLSLSIGYVIGAGVVTMVGQALGLTGRSVWLAYLVAILLGTFINIPYLFLTGTANFSGGPYNLIASLTNEKLGGIYVTAFIAQCMGLSLYGVSFGMYAKSLWPSLDQKIVSLCFMLFIYVINLLGVGIMAKLQKLMTALLLLALVVFIIFGLPRVDMAIFDFNDSQFLTGGMDGFVTAVFLLIFTATAYNMVMNYGRSAKNGKRDIPWAIMATVPVIMVIYVGVAIVNAGAFPLEKTANQPLTGVAQEILPHSLFLFFMIGGPLMALATTLNSCMSGFSAPFIQAAKDGWFPQIICRKNRFGASYVILTLLFAVGLIPVLLDFNIQTITNNIMLVQYILALLIYYAIWQLPKKFPEQWQASRWHVPAFVYNLFMVLAVAMECAIIYYALKGLTATIAGVSLTVMALCTVYAIKRYQSGKVKMETGVWFD